VSDESNTREDQVSYYQVKVGLKCVATIRGSRVAAYGSGQQPEKIFFSGGQTLWRAGNDETPPSAKVLPPYYFAFNPLRRGNREDQTPLTNSFGEPLPQILALIAVRTGRLDDWIKASQFWEAVRSDLLEGQGDEAGKGFEFLKDSIEILLPPPPSLLLQDEPATKIIPRLEQWAQKWIIAMIKANFLVLLKIWDDAAQRSLERISLVRDDRQFITQLTSDSIDEDCEMGRVLRAIKKATVVGGGVPYISRVRSILGSDDGPELGADQVRTIQRTLGFDWIPSEPDWKKHWSPIAQAQGWI